MLLVAALALLALPALANAGFGLGLESKGFELSLGEKRLAYAQGDPLFVILYSEAPDIWAARSWRMVGPDAEVVARGEHGYDFSVESSVDEGVSGGGVVMVSVGGRRMTIEGIQPFHRGAIRFG